MDQAQREFVAGVERCFGRVVDPRVIGRCDHQLLDMVAILILAVLCGAEDWPDVEIFNRARVDWLKTFLPQRGGIPSHDTFRRVFGILERNQFAEALFGWTHTVRSIVTGRAPLAAEQRSLLDC